MFRNEKQRAAVCQRLTGSVHSGVFWTADGPTELALFHRKPRGLSHGESLMIRLAWNVWNAENKAPAIHELWETLDSKRLALVGAFLVAMADTSGRALDTWIADQQAPRPTRLSDITPQLVSDVVPK